MVLVFFGALLIDIARIPFVAEGGDGIYAPVNEDSKLGILVPIGDFVAAQRFPIGTERASADGAIDIVEQSFASAVVFRASPLPDFINLLRGLSGGGLGVGGGILCQPVKRASQQDCRIREKCVCIGVILLYGFQISIPFPGSEAISNFLSWPGTFAERR
jgi:hypothetical protein